MLLHVYHRSPLTVRVVGMTKHQMFALPTKTANLVGLRHNGRVNSGKGLKPVPRPSVARRPVKLSCVCGFSPAPARSSGGRFFLMKKI